MKINNVNHDKIEYKGNKMEQQLSLKEIVNQFYVLVRQKMPLEGDFDTIEMQCDKDDKGEYSLSVETFKNTDTNKYINNLNISYIPFYKDFKMSMRIMKGSKQEILDYLGNEKNLNEIKSLMGDLRRRSDNK